MIKLMVTASALLFLLSSMASAQWTIYNCNELPSLADPSWYPEGEGPTANFEDWFSVINDPVVPGNQLLLFEELIVTGKESYAVAWGADKDIGATVVFRVKASDNFDVINAQNTDTTAEVRWAEVEVTNGFYRENLRLEYNLYTQADNSGYGLYLAQSRHKSVQPESKNFNFDRTLIDWHLYRMTIIDNIVKLYLDEDPTPVVIGETPTLNRKNHARIGDKQPDAYMVSLYDWIIWDVTGAYPPKHGTPIPRNLIGWHTGIEDDELFQPEDFKLYPNFPNPFNPHTSIQFEIVKAGRVNVIIYDVNGRRIRELVNGEKRGGMHRLSWNAQDESGQNAAAGVYVFELQYENMIKRGKMMLLK